MPILDFRISKRSALLIPVLFAVTLGTGCQTTLSTRDIDHHFDRREQELLAVYEHRKETCEAAPDPDVCRAEALEWYYGQLEWLLKMREVAVWQHWEYQEARSE